jgi:hypothetical protein
MSKFSLLPIYNGYGNVHMNRFRVCIQGGRSLSEIYAIGARLAADMPKYMDARTASVAVNDETWKNRRTFKFTGVAKLRPFKLISSAITVPVMPGISIPVKVDVPDVIRDWAIPDLHTDCVGVVETGSTGFTVETLKREYEDDVDKQIRSAVARLVTPAALGVSGVVIGPIVAAAITKWLGDIAVGYNQCHFLSGRRAFRFDRGESFGYSDGRLVFETVAIECFTNQVFASSPLVMGNISDVVRTLWVQMCMKFCRVNGLTILTDQKTGNGWYLSNKVYYMQTEVAKVADITTITHFESMNREHKQIIYWQQ